MVDISGGDYTTSTGEFGGASCLASQARIYIVVCLCFCTSKYCRLSVNRTSKKLSSLLTSRFGKLGLV